MFFTILTEVSLVPSLKIIHVLQVEKLGTRKPLGTSLCSPPPRHLLSLKHYEGDIEELCLNFTIVNNEYGQSKVIALS